MERILSMVLLVMMLLAGDLTLVDLLSGEMGLGNAPAAQEQSVIREEPAQVKEAPATPAPEKSDALSAFSDRLAEQGASTETSAPAQNVATQPRVTPTPKADDTELLRTTWLSKDQYYYQQLSDAHKAAWEIDIDNVLHYPNQTQAHVKDRRNQALASMIETDNPRIFWIDWIDSRGMLRYETGSTPIYEMDIPEGETLASLQQKFLTAIDAAVADISKDIPADADVRTKVKAIFDWICRANEYDEQKKNEQRKAQDPVSFDYLAAHSAYSAIIPGDAYEPVCEGYAMAFKILCEELGVNCICVNGSTDFASYHCWNYVQVEDGSWYLVDATMESKAFYMLTKQASEKRAYRPRPYMNSGVNPENGYTEGAAFSVPELATK